MAQQGGFRPENPVHSRRNRKAHKQRRNRRN
jgi:hypothetical protein